MVASARNLRKLVSALTDKKLSSGEKRIVTEGAEGQKITIRYLNDSCYTNDEVIDTLEAEEGINFIGFPFYCTFTEEVVRYYFLQDLFDRDKNFLQEAIKRKKYKDTFNSCYRNHKKTPGWHNSDNKIHTFTKRGIKRFEEELNAFPDKIYNQVTYSIALDYWKNCDKGKTLKESNNKIWKNLIKKFIIK